MVLYLQGSTFNFLSLFALVLSLGLLVDNAIIIIEGISDNIFLQKLTPFDATKKAIQTFRWPIITGSMTTVFAFFPMMLVISGVSGDFISTIPQTVTVVLLTSVFISLFVLPVFAILFFTKYPPTQTDPKAWIEILKNWYENKMIYWLAKKSRIFSLLGFSFLTMIFAFALFPLKQMTIEVFPKADNNYFTFKLEYPKGTKLVDTKKVTQILNQVFLPYFKENTPWLKNYSVKIGEMSPYDPDLRRGGVSIPETHLVGITVNLVDKNSRELTSNFYAKKIEADLKQKLPDFVKLTLKELKAGPPTGSSDIEIRFLGEDSQHLAKISQDFQTKLAQINLQNKAKLINISDDLGEFQPQLTWTLDRDKLAQYGIIPAQIFQTLRAGVEGVKIFEITQGTEELAVKIKLNYQQNTNHWHSPENLAILKQIPIKTKTGNFIEIGDFATFEIATKATQLNHYNGSTALKVGADIEGKATADEFKDQILDIIATLDKYPSEIIELGGDNEESARLVKEMGLSMKLALFLILIVLVLQFNSFLQALVILTLIPLSLTGVFIGFWLSNTPVSFPTMIGIVSLAGIIVNDAIVLIDQINHQHKISRDFDTALIKAGISRFQPILLTSVTTIFGLIPLALSDPIWQGLGFAIIYGMSISTIITLILVPALILFYQKLVNWFIKWW